MDLISELADRDLLVVARDCARREHVSIVAMFEKGTPNARGPSAARARVAMFRWLAARGWSSGEIGRLFGRDGSTVRGALRKGAA